MSSVTCDLVRVIRPQSPAPSPTCRVAEWSTQHHVLRPKGAVDLQAGCLGLYSLAVCNSVPVTLPHLPQFPHL